MESKKISNQRAAVILVFLAGVAMPVGLTIGTTLVFISVGKTVQVSLFLANLDLISIPLLRTFLLIIAFYLGVKWATEYISKKHFIFDNRTSVINLATRYYIFYVLLTSISASLILGSDGFYGIIVAIISIVIGTVLFYIISKKYFMR